MRASILHHYRRIARDYLPVLNGEANDVVVKDIAALPTQLPDIYQKLTT